MTPVLSNRQAKDGCLNFSKRSVIIAAKYVLGCKHMLEQELAWFQPT
jgi:hypothetical protein